MEGKVAGADAKSIRSGFAVRRGAMLGASRPEQEWLLFGYIENQILR
jgi:hypothetical protein